MISSIKSKLGEERMIRASALSLLATSILLALAPPRADAQDRNPSLTAIRQADRVLSPVLEVREFSGEFERWVAELTDTAPKIEMFRWTTPASGTRSATWKVLSDPPGPSAQVLQTGSAGPAPEPASMRLFRIDFATIDPAPNQTGGTKYWVLLEPVDSSGRAGPTSAPVEITYTQPARSADTALGPGVQVVNPAVELSASSKLGFLRDVLGQNIDLPARQVDDLEAAVNAETLPEADLQLAPASPFSTTVSPDAIPKGQPHHLRFHKSLVVTGSPTSGPGNMGLASFRLEGFVEIDLKLEPGAIYLLEAHVGNFVPVTVSMQARSNYPCLLDFQQEPKYFELAASQWAPHRLLATVQRTEAAPTNFGCSVTIGLVNTHAVDPGDHQEVWYFDSAELTKLTD